MTRLKQLTADAVIKRYRSILIVLILASMTLGFTSDIRWFLESGLFIALFCEMYVLVDKKQGNPDFLILVIWATFTLAASLATGLILQMIFPL